MVHKTPNIEEVKIQLLYIFIIAKHITDQMRRFCQLIKTNFMVCIVCVGYRLV